MGEISDTEESPATGTVEFKIPRKDPSDEKSSDIVENPMFCDVDLTGAGYDADCLLLRLEKKLSQTKSVKMQHSLQTLIQKIREKLRKDREQITKRLSGGDAASKMTDTGSAFTIQDTPLGSCFWSVGSSEKKKDKSKEKVEYPVKDSKSIIKK